MKVKITILVCLIVAAGLVGAAYQGHKTHVAKVAAHQASLQKQVDARISNLQSVNDKMVTKYNALYTECEKGVVIYNGLTTAEKAKAVTPNCGLPLLQ